MKVLLSWIRDFVDVPGTPEEVGARMSLRGLALEGLEPAPPGVLPPEREDEGPDAVMDFEVTANRPDCLSIVGIAREIACAYGQPLRLPGPSGVGWLKTPDVKVVGDGLVPVTIEDPDGCARYAASVADVSPGESPSWMQARLKALGIRPISNIVDITNYVLLELGHPLHAFDCNELEGPAIVVRRARPGESLKTLDGRMRALDENVLVIADVERAAALAGVMGGADSEVGPHTTKIVLESAWFAPLIVRAASRRLGLKTEASYRFERGGDLTAPVRALARALALLELTGAGTSPGSVVDAYPKPFVPATLAVSRAEIRSLLGMDVPADEAERILAALGFTVRTLGGWHAAAPEAPVPMTVPGDTWEVDVPGWRVDVRRSVDLIEEIGRHYGFEHLPSTFPGVEQAPPPSDPHIARDARVRRAMLGMGFTEAVSFAFIERSAAAAFQENGSSVIELANPLSEKFAVMRPSLLPGLLDAISHNLRHGRGDVQLFEIGTRFTPRGEERAVGFAWTGLASPDHWSGARRDVDFYDMKGAIEQLSLLARTTPAFAPARRDALVDGRTADVLVADTRVGVFGLLVPSIAESRGVPRGTDVYVAELDLDGLGVGASTAAMAAAPLPRFPSAVRDISILVDDSLSAETVRGTIRAAAPRTLVAIREFDRYTGKGVPGGKVSLSLRLTFQAPDRTLTDEEVHHAMDGVAAALVTSLGAVQR